MLFGKKKKEEFVSQYGNLVMAIDDVIIDEKGQVGAIGTLKCEIKEFEHISVVDKKDEIVESDVIINELLTWEDKEDGSAEAGDEVSVMFYATNKIKKGMYLVKK